MKTYGKFVSFLVSIIVLMHFWTISACAKSHADTQVTTLSFVSPLPKDTEYTQGLIRVYTEVLRRLGIEFKFKDLPAKRASEYSNEGKVDGELGRVYNYNTKYPNLVRVEEPNFHSRFSAFAIDSSISLRGSSRDERRGTVSGIT